MWDIITFTDSNIVLLVFNAIAAIFGDTSYTSAAIVVALGVFAFTIISVSVNGQKDTLLTKYLASLLIFMLGFGAKTDVMVENRFTGVVQVISNVPLAIAAPASLISNVGYHLTEMTETAFSNTDGQRVTVGGFMSPLLTLSKMRYLSVHDNCVGGKNLGKVLGLDVCATLQNYTRKCSAIKFARDGTAFLGAGEDAFKVLKFESEAHYTNIVDDAGVNTQKTCKDAWTDVGSILVSNEITKIFDKAIVPPKGDGSATTAAPTPSESIKGLSSSAVDTRKLTLAIYSYNHMVNGTTEALESLGQSAFAENFHSSVMLRDHGWIMQGELFIQSITTLLDYLEAISYALAPFIGLLVLTGAAGQKSLLMYVQLLIVFQIMPAMLVITQNIVLDKTDTAYQKLLSSGLDEGSYDFMLKLSAEVESIAAYGAMIASTIVPIMAISLVTGSVYAVSGAFKSIAAPAADTDATAQKASFGSSMYNYAGQTSANIVNDTPITDNATKNLPNIDITGAANSAVTAAKRTLESHKNDFTKNLSNIDISNQTNSRGWSENITRGEKLYNGTGKTGEVLRNFGNEVKEAMDWSNKEMFHFLGKVDGSLAVGSPAFLKALGVDKGVKGTLSGLLGGDSSKGDSVGIGVKELESIAAKYSKDIREAITTDLSKDKQESFAEIFNQQQSKAIMESWAHVEDAQKAYDLTNTIQNGFSIGAPGNEFTKFLALSSREGFFDNIDKLQEKMSPDDIRSITRNISRFDDGLSGLSKDQIDAAATLMHLAQKGDAGNDFAYLMTGNEIYLDDRLEATDFTSTDAEAVNEVVKKVDENTVNREDMVPVNKFWAQQGAYDDEFNRSKELHAKNRDKMYEAAIAAGKELKVDGQKVMQFLDESIPLWKHAADNLADSFLPDSIADKAFAIANFLLEYPDADSLPSDIFKNMDNIAKDDNHITNGGPSPSQTITEALNRKIQEYRMENGGNETQTGEDGGIVTEGEQKGTFAEIVNQFSRGTGGVDTDGKHALHLNNLKRAEEELGTGFTQNPAGDKFITSASKPESDEKNE